MIATPARPEASWRDILLLYGIGVFGMLVVSAAVPALGGIAAEFRPPSPATIGWVMSIPALAAALASLAVGWLVDRWGEKPVMLAGGALVLAGDLGVIASPAMAMLLTWRVIGGLGYVCMVVGAVTMIGRLTSGRRRTIALALWSTVIPASFILASLYGAAFGAGLAWRHAFVAHGCGVALLMLAAVAVLERRAPAEAGASRLRGIGAVVRSPWPFVLGGSFAGAAFLQTGFIAILPRLLARGPGAGEAEVHGFTIAAMVCNVLGAFALGLLLARGVKAWRMGVGAALLCAFCGAGLVLAPGGLALAFALNCGLMLGLGLLVGMWTLLPLAAPSPAFLGATSGLVTQITLLGVLFGPPTAFAASASGSGTLVYLGCGVALALVAWPLWRRSGAGLTIYIGTQGSGIFRARLDPASGALSALELAAQLERPTWLLAEGKVLHAVSELGNAGDREGEVASFAVESEGEGEALRLLARTPSGGGGPTHLALAPGALLVANYGGGSVAALPLGADGAVRPVASLQQHEGSGPHRRQQGPHPHGVTPTPDGRHILAPDMGADRIYIHRLEGTKLTPAATPFVALPPGTGPRLLLFGADGRIAYMLSELSAELFVYRWEDASLHELARTALDAGEDEGPRSAAALALSPDGRFLYASNRRTDAIQTYAIDAASGLLRAVQTLPASGAKPWAAEFAPGGSWLLVAAQGSDRVTVFAVDRASGRLRATGHGLAIPSPTSFAFAGSLV